MTDVMILRVLSYYLTDLLRDNVTETLHWMVYAWTVVIREYETDILDDI